MPAQAGPSFPAAIPGGPAGLAPLPSTLLASPAAAPHVSAWPASPVPGGHYGTVDYFTPSIDKQVPYGAGWNMGKSIRSTDGTPIFWRRFFFRNSAGATSFIPLRQAVPSRTANVAESEPIATSPLPVSNKHISTGGLYREFLVDEQLFDQLTDRQHPWPIQKPMSRRVKTAAAQPKQRRPYFNQLTRYTPAASYGQTATTLLSAALQNTLPSLYTGAGPNNPQTLGGDTYASY
jgi:hypothetical protein